MGNQVTIWFMESKDSHTNEVIATALEGLHSAEKFKTIECSDGKKRNLAEVPDYAFVARLQRSKKDLGISFETFRTQGPSLPTLWTFSTKKRTTLDALKKKGVVHPASKKSTRKSATRF